jgi:hypothetical protein
VAEPSGPDSARIEPPKVCKELKETKEGPTPKWTDEGTKAEEASPFWCAACGYSTPRCAHRGIEVIQSTPTETRIWDREADMEEVRALVATYLRRGPHGHRHPLTPPPAEGDSQGTALPEIGAPGAA